MAVVAVVNTEQGDVEAKILSALGLTSEELNEGERDRLAAALINLRHTHANLDFCTQERFRLIAALEKAARERDDWEVQAAKRLVRAEKAELALAEMRETLDWLRMALGWAVFRENSRVWTSNEMRDIEAKIDAALHPSEDTSDES